MALMFEVRVLKSSSMEIRAVQASVRTQVGMVPSMVSSWLVLPVLFCVVMSVCLSGLESGWVVR